MKDVSKSLLRTREKRQHVGAMLKYSNEARHCYEVTLLTRTYHPPRRLMDKPAAYTVAQGTFSTCKSVFRFSNLHTRGKNRTLTPFLAATLSAFATGVYGIITNHPKNGLLAGAAALNSGVTAATFFSTCLQFTFQPCMVITYSLHLGLREYAISPILVRTLPWPQYERRRRELGLVAEPNGIRNPDASSTPQFWADRRTHNLLDSGLSGAATGGIIRGWKCMFYVHHIRPETYF